MKNAVNFTWRIPCHSGTTWRCRLGGSWWSHSSSRPRHLPARTWASPAWWPPPAGSSHRGWRPGWGRWEPGWAWCEERPGEDWLYGGPDCQTPRSVSWLPLALFVSLYQDWTGGLRDCGTGGVTDGDQIIWTILSYLSLDTETYNMKQIFVKSRYLINILFLGN